MLFALSAQAIIRHDAPVEGARRRVIVTKLRKAGKNPAVLLVGGIGCYSLDNLAPITPTRSFCTA